MSREPEKGRHTSFYIVLLVASIFAFSAVSSFVIAYTLGDLANDLQKLFFPSGQQVVTGSVLSGEQCYGGNEAGCADGAAGQWKCHPYWCNLYQVQNDGNGCTFAGCSWNAYSKLCTGTPKSCNSYSNQNDCQKAGCFWGQTGGGTCNQECKNRGYTSGTCRGRSGCNLSGGETSISQDGCSLYEECCCAGTASGGTGGRINKITVSWLDKNCNPRQIWDVYTSSGPTGQVPTIPTWTSANDCSQGNMRINLDYTNTGSSSTWFSFETQTHGVTQGDGGRISTGETQVSASGTSSHAHWIRMWSEDITERNWLMRATSQGGTKTQVQQVDFTVKNGGASAQCTICPNCGSCNPDFPNCNSQTNKCCKPNGYAAVGHPEYCCSGQIDSNGICTAGTGGQCTNSQTSIYGNTLCMSNGATCSWSSIDTVTIGQADTQGNIRIDFSSASGNEVNFFIVYGRVNQIITGSVPGYGTADFCNGIVNVEECNPSIIARNYCAFKQNGFMVDWSTRPISTSSPARALMPLRLVNGQASISIAPTQADVPYIRIYYQFYRDSGGTGSISSWCDTSGAHCSVSECNANNANVYTGCAGGDQTQTNSYLCIKSGTSSANVGNACWHYPWEVHFESQDISPQGQTTTTTTTSGPPPPTTTSSTTTSSTTSSSTTSTTTTTPTIPPLVINCKECLVNSQCECSIAQSDCSSGLWTAKNKDGTKPLPLENSTDIPPYTILFYPNQTGKVNVTARCFDAFPKSRSNSTEVSVVKQFLICPAEAWVNTPTSCEINNCNSGFANAIQDNVILANPSFTSTPFNITFTSSKVGEVNVTAFCENPVRPSAKAVVKILTTGTATTTPVVGTFTCTNFKCVNTQDTEWECSCIYNNKVGQDIIFQFTFAKSGQVVGIPPAPRHNTVGPGTALVSRLFDCSNPGSGTYIVSWKAYRDETKRNPIAWSTPVSELPQIDC